MDRYQKLSLGVEILGFTVVVVTVFFLAQQTKSLADQTQAMQQQSESAEENARLMTETMNTSVYQALTNQRLEMDRMFVQNPDLRPHFYGGWGVDQVSTEEAEIRADKLYALAELKLDYLDAYLLHARSINTNSYDGTSQTEQLFDEEAFNSYIRYSFANSPVLCEYLSAQNERYSSALTEKVENMGIC